MQCFEKNIKNKRNHFESIVFSFVPFKMAKKNKNKKQKVNKKKLDQKKANKKKTYCRKNIRKIIENSDLCELTKTATKNEQARKVRLEEKEKEVNQI